MSQINPIGAELDGKRCVVTGASGGIGMAIAESLLAHSAQELIVVARPGARLDSTRSALAAAKPSARVDAKACDLAMLREVHSLADRLHVGKPLDVLVLNAAIMPSERRLTAEGMDETFATNQLAPYLLARLMLSHMPKGGRIVVVGADPMMLALEPVRLDDLQFDGDFSPWRAYMRTKNMNVMMAYALARRAACHGVTVNAAHPGVIRTSLGRNARGLLAVGLALARPFLPSPMTGADTPAWLAWSQEVTGVTGNFYVKRRLRPTAAHTLNVDRQEALWGRCAELVGLPT